MEGRIIKIDIKISYKIKITKLRNSQVFKLPKIVSKVSEGAPGGL